MVEYATQGRKLNTEGVCVGRETGDCVSSGCSEVVQMCNLRTMRDAGRHLPGVHIGN